MCLFLLWPMCGMSNIDRSDLFRNSNFAKQFKIVHNITCATHGVIYVAEGPCKKLYVGLTSRQLRRRTREHVLGISAAKDVAAIEELSTLPRHFKEFHNCHPNGPIYPWGRHQ